jgi:hypothetical protein
MALCGLFTAIPIWAEARDDQLQNDQSQLDESQIARPAHKPKPSAHHVDPAAQLRRQMRDRINRVLVGIVS